MNALIQRQNPNAPQFVMTGQFMHHPDEKRLVEFSGQGVVPRSFTVIAAIGEKVDELDLTRNGLVIIDNDNWSVVTRGLCIQASGIRGSSYEQKRELEKICAMKWPEFSAYCRRANAGHSKLAEDLAQGWPLPEAGKPENRTRLGIGGPRAEDNRSAIIREIAELGEFTLPATSRQGMINELMMHQSIKTRKGRMISWNLSMDFPWDRSGHYADGEELNRSYDRRWEAVMQADPEILQAACDKAIAPYMVDGFNVLELGEGAAAELVMGGEGENTMMLEAFSGRPMVFASFRDMNATLSSLDNETLCDLWATSRVLDQEFSRRERAMNIIIELNRVRAKLELEWECETEEEIDEMSM